MHASGIRVDDAAKSAFVEASADASTLFLRYRISNDTFVRADTGKLASDNEPVANWAALRGALSQTATEPCFLVTRSVNREPGKWLLIFFMPEGCTVRDRMVYASSASALKEGLGEGNFEATTFNISKIEECSGEEYEAAGRSMSHDELLTLDEKEKRDGELASHLAMSSTRAQAIVGLPIKASEESIEAMANVIKGTPTAVILSLSPDTEELQVQESGDYTFEQLQGKLPSDEPRYVLNYFSHEHDGKQINALVFVYYCPDDIKAKLKMFYSTCKQVVVRIIDERLGGEVTKSIELGEKHELSTAAVLDDLYPQTSVKKTFKKPARPGRGNARLLSSPSTSSPSASASSAASASPSP